MRTELFDYPLPQELIAQEPAAVRDSSRLMVVDRSTGGVAHRAFRDLLGLLLPTDRLVVNTSRVFKGRLKARKEVGGGSVEILLVEKVREGTWRALTKGASLRPGVRLAFENGGLAGEIVEGPEGGRAVIRFEADTRSDDIDDAVLKAGEVPLPPYIRKRISDPERYQTVYGEREISSAAPTAGLHFTRGLIGEITSRGVTLLELELAVGLDTFIPVREEDIERHRMHSEWFSIGEECAGGVNEAREEGGRVVAVGTTVVRALESAAGPDGRVSAGSGRTGLFITPGYGFRAVDCLITNFHFPRSTPLMLVCAFGGMEPVMRAYREAVSGRYRFYSFGDAMMVV